MKVREVLCKLRNDGWYLVAIRGSYRQFKHPVKAGRVAVVGKMNDDLAPGTRGCPPRPPGVTGVPPGYKNAGDAPAAPGGAWPDERARPSYGVRNYDRVY